MSVAFLNGTMGTPLHFALWYLLFYTFEIIADGTHSGVLKSPFHPYGGRQERARGFGALGIGTYMAPVNLALSSDNSATFYTGVRIARTIYSNSRQNPNTLHILSNDPFTQKLITTPSVEVGNLLNSSLSDLEKERLRLTRGAVDADLNERMGKLGSDPINFIRDSQDMNALLKMPPGSLSPEQKAKMAALGKQYGDLLNKRFNLGFLPEGPDSKDSEIMKGLWQRAQKLASGELKAENLFDRQILAEYQAGEANRQAFKEAMKRAMASGNADELKNWSNDLPRFIEDMKRADKSKFAEDLKFSQADRDHFINLKNNFMKLTGTSSLEKVNSQNFFGQAQAFRSQQTAALPKAAQP